MATIDKKKSQPVEEHSLSSFDMKRGKVAAFSERKQKKYRVVSVQKIERLNTPENIGKKLNKSENTDQTPKRSETVRKLLYGTNRNNGSNRKRKSESKGQQNSISPEAVQDLKKSSYLQGHERSKSAVSAPPKNITSEMAQRMKRAAYLDKLNKDKIKTNTARAETSAVSDNAENHSYSAVPEPHSGYEDKKPYEHKYLSETADSVIPDAKKAITPEMAERMKRAAFIEQKNAEAIRLNRATVVTEAEDVPVEHSENKEEAEESISDVPVEHLEEAEEKSPTSSYLGNSDKAVFDTYNGEVRAYRAKKAYSEFSEKRRKGGNAVIGAAVSEETKKTVSDAQSIVQTVNSSDSVGSAVLDVSSTLAACGGGSQENGKKTCQNRFEKAEAC